MVDPGNGLILGGPIARRTRRGVMLRLQPVLPHVDGIVASAAKKGCQRGGEDCVDQELQAGRRMGSCRSPTDSAA